MSNKAPMGYTPMKCVCKITLIPRLRFIYALVVKYSKTSGGKRMD